MSEGSTDIDDDMISILGRYPYCPVTSRSNENGDDISDDGISNMYASRSIP